MFTLARSQKVASSNTLHKVAPCKVALCKVASRLIAGTFVGPPLGLIIPDKVLLPILQSRCNAL